MDAYTPKQVAGLVNNIGSKRANRPFRQAITLSVFAGAFIAFGGMFYTMNITDSTLGGERQIANMYPITIGGSIFAPLVYWVCYLRDSCC